MVSVRAAKSKGSQFEMSCRDSLAQLYDDILLTKQEGFYLQLDLLSKKYKFAIECKRLRGISWNQLESFYEKLEKKKPESYISYVLFKSNHQPCLVFFKDNWGTYHIKKFEDVFATQFVEHCKRKQGEQHGSV